MEGIGRVVKAEGKVRLELDKDNGLEEREARTKRGDEGKEGKEEEEVGMSNVRWGRSPFI